MVMMMIILPVPVLMWWQTRAKQVLTACCTMYCNEQLRPSLLAITNCILDEAHFWDVFSLGVPEKAFYKHLNSCIDWLIHCCCSPRSSLLLTTKCILDAATDLTSQHFGCSLLNREPQFLRNTLTCLRRTGCELLWAGPKFAPVSNSVGTNQTAGIRWIHNWRNLPNIFLRSNIKFGNKIGNKISETKIKQLSIETLETQPSAITWGCPMDMALVEACTRI